MKVTKLYLDMDGVLCNFEKRFTDLYGKDALGSRDRKNFTTNWPNFIMDGNFENLEWFPGGKELLDFIQNETDWEVEILSSSGGEKFHSEVAAQKVMWLCDKGIPYKANIVPGRKHKTAYATPETILIDDTEDIIVNFNAAGGLGILHKDANETLAKLRTLLV
jgi:hypothetical protein